MADAMKAAEQHVEQPATSELVDRERYHLGALMSFGAIVDEAFVRC